MPTKTPPPPQEKQKRWVFKYTFPGTGKFFRALDRLERSHHIRPNVAKWASGWMFLVGWICELKSWNLWKIFEEHLVISAVVAVGCCFKTPNKKPFLHLLAIFFLAYTPPNKTCHWKIDRWKRRVLFDTVPSTQPQAAKPSRPSRAAFLREVQVAGNLGVATNFCRLGLRMRLIFFFFEGSVIFVAPFFLGSSNASGNFEVYPLNSALSGLGF